MQHKTVIPEFSHCLDAARIATGGRTEKICANAGELAKVAERLDVPALHELSAEITAEPWRKKGCRIRGTISADITQQCVVTLTDFRAVYSYEIDRCFMPDEPARNSNIELALDPLSDDGPDVISNGKIDLGEIVVETIALALAPYPRMPGAEFEPSPDALDDKESISESSPFAALSSLKQPE